MWKKLFGNTPAGNTVESVPTAPTRPPEFPVGTLVIGAGNEWEDLVIGAVTGHAFEDIPIVADCVSGEERVCCCPLHQFSWVKLRALCKLNPYERFAVLAKHAGQVDRPPPKNAKLLGYAEYVDRIRGVHPDQV